jgi:hypothetical protein
VQHGPVDGEQRAHLRGRFLGESDQPFEPGHVVRLARANDSPRPAGRGIWVAADTRDAPGAALAVLGPLRQHGRRRDAIEPAVTQHPTIEHDVDGALRIELPPSRLMLQVGLVFEVAFTGFAVLALFAPEGDVHWLIVAGAWAAALTLIEYLRFGRHELRWQPRRRELTRRLLMKRGVLPFSIRRWTLARSARVAVEAGRGEDDSGFWFVWLEATPGSQRERLFWSPVQDGAEAIAARLGEAIVRAD